ncbi:methyl-accepting chemotaxis protein [Massilia endophytica]|uniref:methyl-accepting chemotaxis protein n=1 Tax=Massilia endophytica TaxID=2899220 RepID=UPI001E3E4DF1|nr:methyl-accepting chemotaxis protein [Massilia endophytica]UGQ48157.1 methyl-accepting chemotaxis protein [Massilia endophytica]
MNISNMKIGMRLAVGFGLVMLLMAILTGVGVTRLMGIGKINDKIIEQDWVKADAANTINVTTRANARRTMELFITSDKAKVDNIYQRIDANKKTINDALGTLDGLVASARGKELLARIKESRAAYVASFGKVAKLLEGGQRDEAVATMHGETLASLDALQEQIKSLVDLQKDIVVNSGAEGREMIASAQILMVGLGVAALLIAAGFAWWITHSITRPLEEAVQLARTVAAGDLTSRITVRSADETGQLLQALKEMNESLVRIVGEVRVGTDTIATASSQISTGNLDLSSRTEEQASSLEETASSMEELTSTVKQNADNARQANVLAQSASEVAVKGGAVVSQVVDTMGSINESAKKIVDIIGVIDGIAFQTNILALNAAVEAARAGEQGRGFAVVATEVRNLAQRSAAAAKEIKSLISDSVEKVDVGSKLVDQAGTTMEEIVESIRRVTDIMGEITAASQEQSAGIEQVNQAITQMDDVTQQNAALVEEAAAATQSLQEQAGSLAKVVSIFKLDGLASSQHHANVMPFAKKHGPAPAPRQIATATEFRRVANEE